MSLLVVGSVALDTIKTPFGEAVEVLGGSATYFSCAASFFSNVKLVAVVGKDFPVEYLEFLRMRNIDIDGITFKEGLTFRWTGEYNYDLNEARTIETQLNVFANFKPDLPQEYRESKYIFLANIDPDLQREVLDQVESPEFIACDTMNYWIERKRESLLRTIKRVNALIINDAEVRELAGESNLVRAAMWVMTMGPELVIIKRGEYGAVTFSNSGIFYVPAFPLESVYDPTGAGDCFAGGFMGYLAQAGRIDNCTIRKAVVVGSVMASFNVEDFSLNRLKNLDLKQIEKRYRAFREMVFFEDI